MFGMKLAKLGQKFTQKMKFIFQPLSILMDFQIIYCNCSTLFRLQMAVSI